MSDVTITCTEILKKQNAKRSIYLTFTLFHVICVYSLRGRLEITSTGFYQQNVFPIAMPTVL